MKTPKTPPVPQKNKQFDLFTSFFGNEKDLSNTIELWDAIPKYAVSARQQAALRDDKGSLPVHEQDFEYRPTTGKTVSIACKLTIQPASIRNGDGTFTQYYPSTDEELLEEVLKKIFTDQQYGIHTPQTLESWVRFSLYMIREELRARGKTRSIAEIKKSLDILARSVYSVEIKGTQKSIAYDSTILSDMTRTTRADYLEDTKTLWCARLPALVSKSINELSYRQINYGTLMALSTPMARWLHKRLSHNYINAGLLQPYNILYSSIHRDSGLLHHIRPAGNIKTFEAALEELKNKNVLWWFKKEERKQGRATQDVLYILQPTNDFISEIKAANARQRDAVKALSPR
ncbi:MAG: hypothetical protein AB7R40_23920 [Nitrospiraceae bacterium]